MATFTDTQGREWSITLDAPKAMAVRAEADPDFLKGDFERTGDNTYGRLLADPVTLCRVIYVLCEKQRREREVSEGDFYLGVMGDAIEAATEALLAAITDFSPPRTQTILKVFAEQDRVRMGLITKAVEQGVEKLTDPETVKKIEEAIAADLGEATPSSSAASTPDYLESTPAA